MIAGSLALSFLSGANFYGMVIAYQDDMKFVAGLHAFLCVSSLAFTIYFSGVLS